MKRLVLKGGVSLVAAGLLVACAEQRFRLGFESDTANPLVTIVKSAGDTIDVQQTGKISFTVQASDNLGINSTAGGLINITATVTDGANNSASASADIFIINLRALTVVLMSPTVGSVTSPGKQIPIRVLAAQQAGIQRVGWQATGVVNAIDSAFYALPDPG